MGIFTKLSQKQIQKILNNFVGLPQGPFEFEGVGLGTVNTYYKITYKNREVFFLKIDEVADTKRLKNELAIFNYLKRHHKKLSFSFPQPLKTQNNQFYSKTFKKTCLVFTRLPGKSIFNTFSKSHLKQVGAAMAAFHNLPVSKTLKPHRFDLNGIKKAYASIKSPLQKKHPHLIKDIHALIKELEATAPKRPQKAFIHADLFDENLHWHKGHLLGILDYEASGVGSPFFDVCVAIHALCWGSKRPSNIRIKALLQGYFQHSRFAKPPQKVWQHYLKLTCLRFVITRLKDFELGSSGSGYSFYKDYRDYLRRFDQIDSI